MNKKALQISFFIIIAIILAGLVGYFAIVRKPETPFPAQAPPLTDQSEESTIKPPATQDKITNWKIYRNEEGKYLFRYPKEWNVAVSERNPKNVRFGPEATSKSGHGGVEYVGKLLPNQSLKDFVKELNKGIEAGSISETEAVINGKKVIISILPKMGSAETKVVSFKKGGEVFNVYLMYYSDFAEHPESKQMLSIFNQLLSTFEFSE